MRKSKLLIIGARGLVGSEFCRSWNSSTFQLLKPSRIKLDISNFNSVDSYLKRYKPEVVINFAAMANLDLAESERSNFKGEAWRVNVGGVINLIESLRSKSIRLIQISTDMVFPGDTNYPGPYRETDKVFCNHKKLSWYGYTKAVGERIIQQALKRWTIIRISYPVGSKDLSKIDLSRKLIKMYQTEPELIFFDDQYLTVSYLPEVSRTIKSVVKKNIGGVLHVSSVNVTTPFDFANKLIRRKFKGEKNLIKAGSIDVYLRGRLKRRYMKYGGLSCQSTQKLIGFNFSTWQKIVEKID